MNGEDRAACFKENILKSLSVPNLIIPSLVSETTATFQG